MSDQTKLTPPEPLPAQPRVPGEPIPSMDDLLYRAGEWESIRWLLADRAEIGLYAKVEALLKDAAARPPASPAWQPRMNELEASIRELRKALYYYAKPDDGWDLVEHANVYEESRALVPDDEEEREEAARERALPAAPPETNQP